MKYTNTKLSWFSDHDLVRVLLFDEIGRLDVIQYLFETHRDALNAVGRALFRQYGFVPSRDDLEELSSIVIESVAELLRQAEEPSSKFLGVAEGDPRYKLEILPYLKGIVRNKVKQRFRKGTWGSIGLHSAESDPGQVVHPDFEHRDSIARIRELIDSISCSEAERVVAELYKSALPDKPGFATIREALGAISDKAARRTAERFEEKLRKVVAARERNEALTLRDRNALVLLGLYPSGDLLCTKEKGLPQHVPSKAVSAASISADASGLPQLAAIPTRRVGRPRMTATVAKAAPAAPPPWWFLGGTIGGGGLGLKGWATVVLILFSSVSIGVGIWTTVEVVSSVADREPSRSGSGDSSNDSGEQQTHSYAAVPEPSTTLLLGLSAVLLAFSRRRKSSQT